MFLIGGTIALWTQGHGFDIRPGSTVNSLIVDLTGVGGRGQAGIPSTVGVWLCEDETSPVDDNPAVWLLVRDRWDAPLVRSFTYGVPPSGYATRHDAEPLTPGCYRVGISRRASTKVTVTADGLVRRSKPEEVAADTWNHATEPARLVDPNLSDSVRTASMAPIF